MKSLAFAAAIALVATGAMADSDAVRKVAPAHNWSGGYVGVGLGMLSASPSVTPGTVVRSDASGGQASLLLGYNWRARGNLMVGAELMIANGGVDGNTACTNVAFQCFSDVGTTAAARLRLGLARDRTLFFGTLGIAAARITYSNNNGVVTSTASHTASGATLGLGFEHAMQNGWNLRGDLEHYRFGRANGSLPGAGVAVTTKTTATAVRLTLVRRF